MSSLAFHLEPIPVSRPWGGGRIAPRFGWSDPGCPSGEKRGEWWLASCRPEAVTLLRGKGLPPDAGPSERILSPGSLSEWLDSAGHVRGCPPSGDFPLLLKFLDSDEILSLQVHPDDATAARHGLPNGKTEAWHILHAEPGARVYVGTAPGVSCRDLLDRVEGGAGDAEITSLLNAIEVAPGDSLLVPAGSVHATGPGIALFEVQQNSDTTYRIHDWGRGRQVHLPHARDAARDLPREQPRRARPEPGRPVTLLQSPAFVLRRALTDGERPLELGEAGRWALLTVIDGHGTLRADGASHALQPGDTLWLLGTAALAGAGLDVLLTEVP
jgi:mannose-6-phosphate isomerase